MTCHLPKQVLSWNFPIQFSDWFVKYVYHLSRCRWHILVQGLLNITFNLYLEMSTWNVIAICFWSLAISKQMLFWVPHWDTVMFPYLGSCFLPMPILGEHCSPIAHQMSYLRILSVWKCFLTCSSAFIFVCGEAPLLQYFSWNLRGNDCFNTRGYLYN